MKIEALTERLETNEIIAKNVAVLEVWGGQLFIVCIWDS